MMLLNLTAKLSIIARLLILWLSKHAWEGWYGFTTYLPALQDVWRIQCILGLIMFVRQVLLVVFGPLLPAAETRPQRPRPASGIKVLRDLADHQASDVNQNDEAIEYVNA